MPWKQSLYFRAIVKYFQLKLSKFIAPGETFRLSSNWSVCYALFLFGKVIVNRGSDEQNDIMMMMMMMLMMMLMHGHGLHSYQL